MTDQVPSIEPDYPDEVGYKHPPKKHRFKIGQSGNPNGRPKKARSYADSVETVLNKTLNIQTADGPVAVTVFEAVYYRMAQDAINNPKRGPKFIQVSAVLRPDLFMKPIDPEEQRYGLVTSGVMPIQQWIEYAENARRPYTYEQLAAMTPEERANLTVE